MVNISSCKTARHYCWGANAEGWHLLESDSLSVIEELLPPNEAEQRHYHAKAQQFFYILAGICHLEVAGEVFEITPGSGLHVPAGEPHQLFNRGKEVLRILVISEPKSHGDRIYA